MKLAISLLIALVSLVRAGSAVLAVTVNQVVENYLQISFGSGACSTEEITGLFCVLGKIINILISTGGVIALIFLAIGGLQYMVSGGDEKALATAKATITYSILGLLIVLGAILVVNIALTTLGV
ncbi:MAG: hypothetical protein BMS9Abin34_029 [Patescibacteria group bacterium]|nr:MAG: hypothetical protein BMS9Abin34_029 [Patescibacteria group bacterium]